MDVIKGSLDQLKIFENQDLDVSNCTYIFIQNNGSVTAYFGNRKIEAGKEIEIKLTFLINKQTFNIRFDQITGKKELYLMLGKATMKCN